MSKRLPDPIHISERELGQLTHDMDDMHHELMPAMRQELAEWAEANPEERAQAGSLMTSRRHFLLGAAGLGGLVLAGCSSKKKGMNVETGESGGTGSSASGGGLPLSGDVQFIAMSASLENLAVGTYQAAIDAVVANKLTGVPPAVVTFAKTAQQQHRDHASAFNAIVMDAGHRAVSEPDMVVKPIVDQAFAQVKSVADLAKLARLLENTAAATYQDGVNKLSDKKSVMTLASIQPVERQHAAILSYVLGEYPVPDTFSSTSKKGEEARPASDVKG